MPIDHYYEKETAMKQIQLSDHFNTAKLLRFTLPSIVMMIFTSIYSVVDGFFVSNFVGKTPFAAVNFVMPVLMILGGIGFMFGTGGSALVAKTMGEGDMPLARRRFSMIVILSAALGVVIAIAGLLFVRPLCALLGAEGEMLDYCAVYGRILMAALPFFMLQYEFQSFFIAAERPQMGLIMTVVSGVMNMVLDALFMAVFGWGLVGAAVATSISQVVGALIPIIYFLRPNSSPLQLVKPEFEGKALLKTCANGSSELMSNISMSLVSMLYNIQLIKFAGEDGVAAYGVLMYINMIFLSAFIGYATGIAPVVSFHYGAQNHPELKRIFKRSLAIIGAFSLAMFGMGEALARPLSLIFVSYDAELLAMTVRAFAIYSFSFLFSGMGIFGSAFFTALNDGLTSALIAFLRTLVFQVAAVLLLPLVMGIDGIWVSIVIAECLATIVTVIFLYLKRNKFRYI